MTLGTATREQLEKRQREAHAASEQFDFIREGSLATFWRQATPGTTYWRCVIPALRLPGQVLPLTEDATDLQQGTAIWQFLGDVGRTSIATYIQSKGVRTLMEVDDNYLRFAPTLYGKHGAWAKTHDDAVKFGNGYSVEQHRKIVPTMDGIIVATDALADEYSDWNDNVYVCRNSVLPEDWVPVVREENPDVLRIGYYGSVSHLRDYPVVKKALKWARRQPGVDVVMIGLNPPGWNGTAYPWEDGMFAARMHLGKIDVGIAPLTRNAWADGKSDVKAMEYAMAGVMPILHDAPPYSPWKDIGWEWMPKNEQEWEAAIHDVVAMRDDVPVFAAAAKGYVMSERTIDKNIHLWREAISDGA